MSSSQSYRINQPAVITEVIDGEAIVVNLDSGAYYSLRDSACVAWELFAQQMPVSGVVAQMVSRYDAAPDVIATAVETLLAELLQENLLVAADAAPDAPSSPFVNTGADRPPFALPVLEKFTDMADLLLLDPIHDVDDAGWPHPAPASLSNT